MLTYNLDMRGESSWLRTTPGSAALAQPYRCTEAGLFYAGAHFSTARTHKESYILFYSLSGAGLIEQGDTRVLLEPGRALLLDCPMDSAAAARAVGEFLASGAPRPTALLCANEECAIGALRALEGAGLGVPGEMSVVSFNDTPRSALVEPPLTSVSAHVEEMARIALRLLADRACPGGKEPLRTLPIKVVVPPSLVVRSSSGPVCE